MRSSAEMPRPRVRHSDHDALPDAARRHRHLGSAAALRDPVFQRVVDEVGDGLAQKLAVEQHVEPRLDRGDEADAVLLRRGLVELDDIRHHGSGVALDEGVPPRPGLGARDHQQRVEDGDQPVGLADDLLEGGALAVGVAAGAQGLLGTVAQPGERRAEVVGDIVGNFAHADHQPGDAGDHGVEVGRQPVELVAGAGQRQAARHVPVHDGAGARVHGIDAAQDAQRHDEAADEPHQHHPEQRREQRVDHHVAQVLALLEVTADEQAKAARQQQHLGERQMRRPALAVTLVGDLDQAGMVDDARRQGRHIAGQRLARVVGHEVERGSGLLGAALHGGDQLADAAGVVLLAQPAGLGLDGLADLPIEELVDVPVDAAEHDPGPDGEDDEIGQRQLERRRAEQLTDDRHGSCIRRPAPCGAAAPRTPGRSSSEAGRYGRR